MKTVPISGVIGWDVSACDIRKELDEAKGEALDIQISSPGGFVTDGLEIFNLIKNYKGEKTCHLMGMAASMASYIALAGDKCTAEANSVFMIHNALGCAMGNHNDLRKAADVFEGFSNLLAQAYAKKCGKALADVRSMMDSETYLFGAEAKDAGFVDEILGEPTEDKAAAISIGKAARAMCDDIVRKFADQDSLPKLAALIPVSPAGNPSSAAAVAAPISPKEAHMDPDALKAEQALIAQGEAAGITKERARVSALRNWVAADPKNTKLAAAVDEAIATGKTEADVMPQLQVALRDGKVNGDNAPAVASAASALGAGSATDPEEAAILAKAGLPADFLKGVK